MGFAWWEISFGSRSSFVRRLEIRECRGGRKSNCWGGGSSGLVGLGGRGVRRLWSVNVRWESVSGFVDVAVVVGSPVGGVGGGACCV